MVSHPLRNRSAKDGAPRTVEKLFFPAQGVGDRASHPCRNDKDAARMGHPWSWLFGLWLFGLWLFRVGVIPGCGYSGFGYSGFCSSGFFSGGFLFLSAGLAGGLVLSSGFGGAAVSGLSAGAAG